MTRSEAPFHGAHGEGRSAISPAASQSDAEPCARKFSAARARKNAPVISDNAVVAAPITGVPKALAIPCPCRARRHNRLKSWQKSIGHADFGCAAAPKVRQKKFSAPGRWSASENRSGAFGAFHHHYDHGPVFARHRYDAGRCCSEARRGVSICYKRPRFEMIGSRPFW